MINKIHMVGIGGIGMSAIARCLLARGYEVSGSDLKINEQIERLIGMGVTFYKGHNVSNIDTLISTVIRSAAIKDNNEEILETKKLGIKIKILSETNIKTKSAVETISCLIDSFSSILLLILPARPTFMSFE